MVKRLLVAVLVACALVGLGVLLERWMLKPWSSPDSASRSADPMVATGTSSRRAATLATALELEGVVEHKSPGAAWRPLAVGATVDISDQVRTGPSSRARLQLGTQVTVQLSENTGINIAQLSETLSRIRLADGRVVSEVSAAKGFLFRVQVQGNNAQAETSAGRFAVLRRGNAPAVFAAERGVLNVTGATHSVTLQEGEQTLVADGGEPSAPMKLPSSLLLKLGEPPARRVRNRLAPIRGETSPGAVVTLGKQVVAPSQTGHFTSTVALIDGPNEIVVEVEDVAGRRQTAKLPTITLDNHAPRVKGKVVW